MVLTNEMDQIPGEKILKEILNGNEKVLTKIYSRVYRQMTHLKVSSQSGPDEVKEAVQDAFEVFYRQLASNQLQLTCSVETYVISIAKRLMLKQERDYYNRNKSFSVDHEDIIDENKSDEEQIQQERYNLFWEEYQKLEKDCRRIISLSLKGFEAKEIMKKMNLKSESYAKLKRQRCKTYLIERIKENPRYEELRNATPEDIELFK